MAQAHKPAEQGVQTDLFEAAESWTPPVQPGQALCSLSSPSEGILSPWEPAPSSWGQSQLQRLAAKALCPLTLVLHQHLQNVHTHIAFQQPGITSKGVASSSVRATGLSKATQQGLEASEVPSDPPKSKDSNLSCVCALPGESHPRAQPAVWLRRASWLSEELPTDIFS